ncbi:diguanylate cyclase [Psychromonas sp. KJ10-10]|uniref:sensor domain-containing diguanylate cyclase n=1 Tax=Psychromonas sp. KJ10-10 TaxID=3391823 RepID=UPI0039B55831
MDVSEKLLIEPHYGVVIHRDFKPLYADDNYANFYGYHRAEEILSLNSVLELIAEEDHPKAKFVNDEIMSGRQKPGVRTFQNIDKTGKELTVLAIDNITEWEGLPAMQVIIIDLSYQFEMQRSLKLSEERYRVLVDGSIQGILVHKNFNPLFCNQAYAEMFGFENEQALLANESILATISSEYHQIAYRDNQALMTGEEAVIKAESKGVRTDGSIVWLSLLSRPVLWDGEQVIQVTAIDITEQHLLSERLEYRANYDALTNLLTRRALNELLEKECSRALRHANALCCVLIDIDKFKQINDKNGHHIGDEVLKLFASTCEKSLRKGDFIGRWGGDEFVLILPQTELEQAVVIAQRLCSDVTKLSVPISDGVVTFSISLGVASLSSTISNVELLLSEADTALYKAKDRGRGCVASTC